MPVIAMHMDVRPAVDTPTAALLRLRVFFMRFIGINPFGNSAVKGVSKENASTSQDPQRGKN